MAHQDSSWFFDLGNGHIQYDGCAPYKIAKKCANILGRQVHVYYMAYSASVKPVVKATKKPAKEGKK